MTVPQLDMFTKLTGVHWGGGVTFVMIAWNCVSDIEGAPPDYVVTAKDGPIVSNPIPGSNTVGMLSVPPGATTGDVNLLRSSYKTWKYETVNPIADRLYESVNVWPVTGPQSFTCKATWVRPVIDLRDAWQLEASFWLFKKGLKKIEPWVGGNNTAGIFFTMEDGTVYTAIQLGYMSGAGVSHKHFVTLPKHIFATTNRGWNPGEHIQLHAKWAMNGWEAQVTSDSTDFFTSWDDSGFWID